ncbi:MAG: TPM domain-containing protein [Candidatus Peribacteraceae bacterium]|nr:TPM domain-containing protein [Candidatus Peribacteraceae bacterium]
MTHFFHRLVGMFAVSLIAAALLVPSRTLAEFAVPPNDGFLTDAAGIIDADAEQRIESRLQAYKDSTSNEIAVVIVRTLDGYPIEQATLEIGRKWGVGSVKANGLLMLVA